MQHGPQLATVLLVCALAAEAGIIVTSPSVAVPAARSGIAVPGSLRRPGAQPVSSFDLPGIVNAHLFGRPADTNPDNAPQTAMSLVLSGVLAVSNPEQGMAIIGPSAAAAKLYMAGSALPGGARLHAIYNDRVLLERDGALEALYLPKQSSSGEPGLQNATLQNSPVQRLQNIARGPNNQLLNGLIRVMPLQDLHNRGKLLGFRLYPGPGAAAGFARLGFLPGDEITAVNGTPLNDAENSNAVLQTLSSSATASVTIVRNGVAQEMNLNLDAVATEAESATQAASQTVQPPGRNFGGRFGANRDSSLAGPLVPPAPVEPDSARSGAIPPLPDPIAAGPEQ
ncbi:MAG TPA: type II secretion system protein N [Steroidobacteraceae bacterium]